MKLHDSSLFYSYKILSQYMLVTACLKPSRLQVILPLRRDRAPGRAFLSSLRVPLAPAPSPRRPPSGGPSRPPKPKPHRPLFAAPLAPPPVRRWRSALWPSEPPEAPELSKTAPASLCEPAPDAPSAVPEAPAPRADELRKEGEAVAKEGPDARFRGCRQAF